MISVAIDDLLAADFDDWSRGPSSGALRAESSLNRALGNVGLSGIGQTPTIASPRKPAEIDPEPEQDERPNHPDPNLDSWWHAHPVVQKMLHPKAEFSQPLKGGTNGAHRVVLGSGHEGVWKPRQLDLYDKRPETVPSNFARREALAWEVAHHLGVDDLVPPTIHKHLTQGLDEHLRGPGSLQTFVPSSHEAYKLPGDQRYDGPKDFLRAAYLDYVLGSTDRHGGNWLLTPEGKLALIDNGFSFPRQHQILGESYILDRALHHGAPLPEEARFGGRKSKLDAISRAAKRAKLHPQEHDLLMDRVQRAAAHAKAKGDFSGLWHDSGIDFLTADRFPAGGQGPYRPLGRRHRFANVRT